LVFFNRLEIAKSPELPKLIIEETGETRSFEILATFGNFGN